MANDPELGISKTTRISSVPSRHHDRVSTCLLGLASLLLQGLCHEETTSGYDLSRVTSHSVKTTGASGFGDESPELVQSRKELNVMSSPWLQ